MDNTIKATFTASALQLLKARLDRMPEDTGRDDYFTARVEQSIAELERQGIVLTDAMDDLMLVVDHAAWNHANRDKQSGMPDWLRRKIVARWINNRPQEVEA